MCLQRLWEVCVSILISMVRASRSMPSAYVWKKPPMKNMSIQMAITFQYQCPTPRRSFLTTGYTRKREIGLSSRICRLNLTVGCCENIMMKSIIPANPVVVSSVASNNHMFL